MINKWKYESPIGILYLYEDGHALIGVSCDENGMDDYFLKVFRLTCEQLIIQYNKTELLFMTEQQLDEYFKGVRKEFSIPLRMYGTEFQQKVWTALQTVPYGTTCSYKDIASKIGNVKACRAVGMANNKNPIMIIIPCHRVIGADGSLVGYGGGLDKKEYLLRHELKVKGEEKYGI